MRLLILLHVLVISGLIPFSTLKGEHPKAAEIKQQRLLIAEKKEQIGTLIKQLKTIHSALNSSIITELNSQKESLTTYASPLDSLRSSLSTPYATLGVTALGIEDLLTTTNLIKQLLGNLGLFFDQIQGTFKPVIDLFNPTGKGLTMYSDLLTAQEKLEHVEKTLQKLEELFNR